MEERMEFPGWPVYTQDEIDAVGEVLASGKGNYWTGPHGGAFEKEFAAYHGSEFAVALANGTLALELALRALGIGPGDDVVVPCRTFIATASAVVAVGARPIVADIDEVSGNVCAATIEEALTPETRAVIVVHLGGWPCEMDAILELVRVRGVKLIEDCAQALGAEYKGRKVGTFGHVAAFSFCQDKIISTGGEGGMLLTNDPVLWQRAWAYKDHGKNPEKALIVNNAQRFIWMHDEFGSNARMTEMQAVIGRKQMEKLDGWLERRLANGSYIANELQDVRGLYVPMPPQHILHAYYRCYIRVREAELAEGWSRDRIVTEIRTRGVPCFQGGCSEIYCEKAFLNAGFEPKKRFPIAQQFNQTALCFLAHPTLKKDHVKKAMEVARQVMQVAVKS
ncbi:MAG: aminotransferase [Zetaproteobacteria bacterium CG1_02_55_237]|nr:MAG: aminotransferase [Zetaproteobacteria bacterium CG1_02_55_237]